jgi:hypothetical protein
MARKYVRLSTPLAPSDKAWFGSCIAFTFINCGSHPQQCDRRTAMPEMGVTADDARQIAAYLDGIR